MALLQSIRDLFSSRKPAPSRSHFDPTFGELTFEGSSWSGFFASPAESVELVLACEADGELAVCLDRARTALATWEAYVSAAREVAARDLLELKNGTWLEDDESEVSRDDFQQRLEPEGVTFYADGTSSFYFGDGDLFWGHTVIVSGELAGFTRAEIAG